jgi:HSP20 family protein
MARNATSNQTKEQNPRQGASTTTGKASDAEQRERERSIETQREGRLTKTPARRGLTSPVYGSGSPFSLMRRMAEDMDRVFQDFGFGRTGLGLTPSLGLGYDRDLWRGSGLEQSIWTPQIETFRRGDNLVIRADLPGLKKEDVKVEIDNDVLTISGERSEESEEERDDFYRSERSYGQFYRAIPLPDGVGADQVDASFKDGVLEVTLPAPKQSERETKRIQIR